MNHDFIVPTMIEFFIEQLWIPCRCDSMKKCGTVFPIHTTKDMFSRVCHSTKGNYFHNIHQTQIF